MSAMQDYQVNGRCNLATPVSPRVCPPRSLPANSIGASPPCFKPSSISSLFYTYRCIHTPFVLILKPPLLPVLGLKSIQQRMYVILSNSYVLLFAHAPERYPLLDLLFRVPVQFHRSYASQPHSFGRISRRCSNSFLLEHFPFSTII